MSSLIKCPAAEDDSTRGVSYLAVAWALEAVIIITIAFRLYTRCWLTRSAGSDDITIVIAWLHGFAGMFEDQIAFNNGYGRHCAFLSHEQLTNVMRMVYVAWPTGLLNFFFTRASVMLFTLRLLPRTKRKSQWIVIGAFILNLAITLLALISFGVSCRPYTANWDRKPGSKCASDDILIKTNIVNGVLAAIIDFATALIPAFLLWNLQIKRTTKLVLDAIFLLGLCTAALSIGRAATLTHEALTTDLTWNILVPDWFKLIESKLGVVVACGPALRQFVSHCLRERSMLPSAQNNPPNGDFALFRHRLNVRDFFWRGKRDPSRAQGLLNYYQRQKGSEATGDGHSGVLQPEDSALSGMEQRVQDTLSHV